jgi:hypothetical protein
LKNGQNKFKEEISTLTNLIRQNEEQINLEKGKILI